MLLVRYAKFHNEDFRRTPQAFQVGLRSRRERNERNGSRLDRKICGAGRKETEVEINPHGAGPEAAATATGPLPCLC